MARSIAIIGTRGYPSYYGGFETLVRQLAPYLADHGWAVTVYGRRSNVVADGADPRVDSVFTLGVDSKSASTLTFGLTSTLHALKTKPDVALVMNVANGFWIPMLRARGIPTLVNVDGIEWEREKWGRGAKAVFKVGGSLTARHATTLIYDSTELGVRWQNMSGREGIYIPYGGVPQEPGDVPAGLGKRKYILMVARFVPENTIEPFLAAAETLSERWDVVIVGSSGYGGDIESRVAALADRIDNVQWFGHVHDDAMLFSLWANAGAYFHGHSVGGTNPALVQAMACGAPIVARDTVYNREVLEESAVFTDPDPDSIAKALDGLISDVALQEELSTRAKERARERYTWSQVCAGYDAALRAHLPS